MIEKLLSYKKLLNKQNISLVFYLFAIFILVISMVISMLLKSFKIFDFGFYIVQMFLILGMVIDTYKLYNIFSKIFMYLISPIVTYFTYIQSEALAKAAVYSVVHTNPDLFQTSVKYLAGLYFIPSLFIFLAPLAVIAFIVSVIPFAFLPFLEIFKEKDYIRKKAFHIAFYFIGVFTAIMGFLNLNVEKKYNDFLGDQYIAKAILNNDYYKNQTCDDIGPVYIKYLNENMISKSNMEELNYSFFGTDKNSMAKIKFDNNISCKRIDSKINRN